MDIYINNKSSAIRDAIQTHIKTFLTNIGKDDSDELGVLEKTLSDLAEVRKSALAVLDTIKDEDKKIREAEKGNEGLIGTAELVGKRVADRVQDLIGITEGVSTNATPTSSHKSSFGLGKGKIQVTKKEIAKMQGVYTKSIEQVKYLYEKDTAKGSTTKEGGESGGK